MKTLLVRLDYRGFPIPQADLPLGVLYLAAALEKSGREVIVRDLNRQTIEDEIFEQIKSGEIGMVGISMLSYVRSEGFKLIKKIKEINPECFVVIGGIFALVGGDAICEKFPVDAVAIGEGEKTVVELAEYVDGERDLKSVRGVYTKAHGWHETRDLYEDIDDIPFPAWHHSDFDWFQMTCARLMRDKVVNGVQLGGARWAPVIASRGCKGRCVFCNAFDHWGRQVRLRSAENLLDEVQTLYSEHGIRLLAFNDDAFPSDKEQCLAFCNGLKERGINIAWQTTARADAIDDDVCRAMAEAGCFMVAVGIESGSKIIHRGMKKGINLDKAVDALRAVRRAGMISYALLMVGLPNESDETVSETIEFLKRAEPNWYSFVRGVMIVPATELCRMAVGNGQIDNRIWLDENLNGLPSYEENGSSLKFNAWADRIEGEIPRCLA